MEQKRGRRRLGEAKWREMLREFDAGGETVEVFCQREGVAKSTFHRWRSCLVASASRSPANAPGKPTPKPMQAGFLDLGALSLPGAGAGRLELTLDLGGGVTLRVARG